MLHKTINYSGKVRYPEIVSWSIKSDSPLYYYTGVHPEEAADNQEDCISLTHQVEGD